MRAIVYSSNGDSGVLRLVEREVPRPGPGEVRVRLEVAGVNPTDWKNREGSGLVLPAGGGGVTPGQDGAGVVDAVGAGVTDRTAGQRVWVYLAQHRRPTGTAAEHTVVPAERAVPLPDGVSADVGASLGVPAMTAHRALTVAEGGPDRLRPGALAGRTVLVTGGAGAVGHAAVQLARWAGASVLSTVSGPEKAALARAAGAQHVVNYREGDPAAALRAAAPDGVDLVVDVALAANLDLVLDVVRPGAVVASYADDGGGRLDLDVRRAMVLNTRFQFVLLYTVGERALRAAADDVTAAAADGALPVGAEHGLPLLRHDLADTPAAHDAVRDGAVGKVVVDVTR